MPGPRRIYHPPTPPSYTSDESFHVRIRKAVITAAGRSSALLPFQTLVDRDGPEKSVLAILLEEVLAPTWKRSASWSGRVTRRVTRKRPAGTPRASGSSQQPQPRGYGHAVWCAREFTAGEPFLHLVGDHLYVSCGIHNLRAATRRGGPRGSLHRLGRAGHARKPAPLLRHGRRPPHHRTRRPLPHRHRHRKAHAHRSRTAPHRAGPARRPLSLLLRHARAYAGGDGPARDARRLARPQASRSPPHLPSSPAAKNISRWNRATAATTSAHATASSPRSWRSPSAGRIAMRSSPRLSNCSPSANDRRHGEQRMSCLSASSPPAIPSCATVRWTPSASPPRLRRAPGGVRRPRRFRRTSDNLYERVRALFFLYAIHRFHLPLKPGVAPRGLIPFNGSRNLLKRRFEEAIDIFLAAQSAHGPSDAISSALAAAYRALGFQTLADQVRRSVRSVRGNQWMFRIGPPRRSSAADPARTARAHVAGALFPDPARSHAGAHGPHAQRLERHLLPRHGFSRGRARAQRLHRSRRARPRSAEPRPPVEAYLRVIDEPVLRLTSVDLEATAEITTLAEVFDFAQRLSRPAQGGSHRLRHRAARNGRRRHSRSPICSRASSAPGRGLEIVSKVNDIPKGSRLAVSTNLLACADRASACGPPARSARSPAASDEDDRRLVAARAILGEWLGGSGGGWQDSGGVWPGMKLIEGVCAQEGDPEFGISRGRLLPAPPHPHAGRCVRQTRRKLQDSLVLVHGGMAQNVGPILEMVTEKYLLRSEAEWKGRKEAMPASSTMSWPICRHGDVHGIGAATDAQFQRPHPDHHSLGRQPLHRDADRPRARRVRRRLLGLLDARRHVRRRHGIPLRSRRESARAGTPGSHHVRDQAAPRTRRPVRHGAGGLRLRHQRARNHGASCSPAMRRSCRRLLQLHRALAAPQDRACSRPRAARNWTGSAPPAAARRSSPESCRTSSSTCCRARRDEQSGAAENLDSAARRLRLRPRPARADSGRPAQRPHRPCPEPASREQHRSRTSRPSDVSDATDGLPERLRHIGMDALADGRGGGRLAGRRRRKPLDQGRRRRQGAASVLPIRRQAPQLHRSSTSPRAGA